MAPRRLAGRAVLAAALAEFVDHGYQAARLDAVARRLGVSKAALYLHYPGKAALFERSVEARLRWLEARCTRRLARLPAGGEVGPRAVLLAFAGFLADPRVTEMLRLAVVEGGAWPALARRIRAAVLAPWLERLGRALAVSDRSAPPASLPPALLAILLARPLLGEALGGAPSNRALVDVALELAGRGDGGP